MDRYSLTTYPCKDDPTHVHARFVVDGWECCLDAKCSEYFELGGICTQARADAILAVLNAAAPARLEAAE